MFKLINSLSPRFIKKFLIRIPRKFYKTYWENVDKQIPKFELTNKHLKNLKPLTTRQELLKLMPKGGVVAELGVDEGTFSSKIIEITQPSKLYLIDVWESTRYNKTKQHEVENKFEHEIATDKVEIRVGYSTEVVKGFDSEMFDWIYIDTDHTYKTTLAELELYHSKIKPGGIMAGHDFRIGNWNGMVRYGVIEAVYEFCVKHNWELVYVTMENLDYPSFAIRKIIE